MKLQFKVFGYTLCSLEAQFDLPTAAEDVVKVAESLATPGVKGISRWWLKRLI